MDYGFHAPTLSFPVHGTLMVEPTESESMQELDRFAETLISIYHEMMEVKKSGNLTDNPLKNAPHTQEVIAADEWNHPYSRFKAAFPLPWVADKTNSGRAVAGWMMHMATGTWYAHVHEYGLYQKPL